jgi:DNA-binding transcriptional LysR family regulator
MNRLWLPAQLAAFAKVAELQSFSAAGLALGVPKVAISRAVSDLEKQVGARLLNRTTRRVSLTPAGEILRLQAARIDKETEAAWELAAQWQARRQGPLRVRAEPAYGRALLSPLVPRFLEAFPAIALDVELSDIDVAALTPEALEASGDVFIRVGRVDLAGLANRELGSPPAVLCATPAYLQKHGTPEHPEDLAGHALLVPESAAAGVNLHWAKGSRQVALTFAPKLVVNDPAVLHSSTVAGLGIGLLPEFLCRQGLATQKLKRVLADWQLPELPPLCAVHRNELAQDDRVVALIEFLTAHIIPALAAR